MSNKKPLNILNLTGLEAVITANENNRINNSNIYSGIAAIQGITRTADIIEAVTAQSHIFDSLTMLATNKFTMKLTKALHPLLGLTTSLQKISQVDKLWADKIANIATSQLCITSTLQNALLSTHSQQQPVFNNLNVAIAGVSVDFLKQIAISKSWEEICLVEETNTIISDVIKTTYNEENLNSANDDIERLEKSIISALSKLLNKTKTQRAKEYIIDLMTLISFMLAIYNQAKPLEKEHIQLVTKQEFIDNNDILVSEIETAVNKYFSKKRIAKISTVLKYSDKKNAKVIGIVQQWQEVTVIEINHKHLLISFIDKDTGEPKSGFVLKKYFIPIQR